MGEKQETFIAKFIRKPYDDYCHATQEQLKTEYCLQLTYIRKPKDDDKIISHYAGIIKKLAKKYRTILFYDVPIQLSQQQFLLLYLLMVYGDICNSEYAELSEALSGKKMKKSAIEDNLKSFISDFINSKILETIKKRKEKSYFTNMQEESLNNITKKLISYNKRGVDYVIRSSFVLQSSNKI